MHSNSKSPHKKRACIATRTRGVLVRPVALGAGPAADDLAALNTALEPGGARLANTRHDNTRQGFGDRGRGGLGDRVRGWLVDRRRRGGGGSWGVGLFAAGGGRCTGLIFLYLGLGFKRCVTVST
jgi:hypothetical protein